MARLIFNEEGELIDDEINLIIQQEKFVNMFGHEWSFNRLISHENATEAWKDVFENWKQRGIL